MCPSQPHDVGTTDQEGAEQKSEQSLRSADKGNARQNSQQINGEDLQSHISPAWLLRLCISA
jgi:hypothetical protein